MTVPLVAVRTARPRIGSPRFRSPSPRSSRPRVVVLTTLGLALALLGAGALVLAGLQRSEGGFFTTGSQTLSTATSALVSDEVLVERRRPGDPAFDLGDLAQVRVRARTPAEGKAIFIGIGPKRDVEAYLQTVSHDRMVSFEVDPFLVHYTRSSGGPASSPAAEPFWVATATGAGQQALVWNKLPGAWSAVATNADGTPGVTVTSDIGLRFGFLLPVGLALLTAGLMLLVAGRWRRQSPSKPGATRAVSTPTVESPTMSA